LCLLVAGSALWVAKNAEPVWNEEVASPEPPQPEPEPVWIEPLDMVELAGGAFWMGSPDSDEDAYDEEKPRYEVTLSEFCISRYPIMRQLYQDIMGVSPERWERDQEDDRLPASYVSWCDAVAFCNALSERVGLQPCYRIDGEIVEWDANADGYRLPTEAEWEYACRAGTETKWFCGDDPSALERYAWFGQRSVQPVGAKEPNPWGLHDMAGNVWEWCWDWFGDYDDLSMRNPTGPENGNFRVLRGGAFVSDARDLRSADRDWVEPEYRDDGVGFRCVRRPRRQL
ncbi:MAG: formylglycine-generating enzyme family protein, partial [Candidatus Tectomicrobia bacterium]|nr:formylglycine-generating enzyme family protein [Candidatus Tectomicrobia bacterium]